MKDLTVLRRVSFVLMIAWMGWIFFMSSRDATTSTEDSERIGIIVGRVIVKDFDSLPEEKRHEFAASIDHKVRKCAHAAEYMLLAFLALGTFCGTDRWGLWAFLTASVYAVTDEVHQTFVPGRSGKVLDVINDSLAAGVGILLVLGLLRIIGSMRKKNG